MSKLAELQSRLTAHRQSHLLQWWDHLDDHGRSQLVAQLESIDFPLIRRLFQSGHEECSSGGNRAARAVPPTQLIAQPRTDADREHWRQATARGEELLRDGVVGAILVAGARERGSGSTSPRGCSRLAQCRKGRCFRSSVSSYWLAGVVREQ